MNLFASVVLVMSGLGQDSLPVGDTAHVYRSRSDFSTTGRLVQNLLFIPQKGNLGQQLFATGNFVRQYGVGGVQTLSCRGGDAAQTQLLWNGLPVNNPMLGMTDLGLFPVWGSNELLLIEGGNAVCYGSGSVAGALQLNQGKFQASRAGIKVMQGLGSWSACQSGIDFGINGKQGFLRGTGYFSHAGNHFSYHEYNSPDAEAIRMKYARVQQYLARVMAGTHWGKWQLRTIQEYNRSFRGLGLITGSTLPQGELNDQAWRGLGEAHRMISHGNLNLRLGAVRDVMQFVNPGNTGTDSSHSLILHAQSEYVYQSGPWRWMAGADWMRVNGFAKAYIISRTIHYPAQFAAVSYQKQSWLLSTTARMEWKEKIPVFTAATEKTFRGWKWKSLLHTSFRRPTLNDQFWEQSGNELLQPERGAGAESGLSVNGRSHRFMYDFSGTLYARMLRNPIVWQLVQQKWQATNLFSGKYMGMQLQGTAQWHCMKNVFLCKMNLHLVNTSMQRNEKEETGYAQIFVPPIAGLVLLAWSNNQWNAGISNSFTGQRFTTTDNLDKMPSFWLSDIYAGYAGIKFKSCAVSCNLRLNNVLNTWYQNMPGRPMPGRSFNIQFVFESIK
ncbi:MAG: TonB-dependent receptor plug domain-containing protein [Bacteroidetes bacterium]|nr:TonB-dependent receptor plug domain-containing protein [Bacteroidota bacterium]